MGPERSTLIANTSVQVQWQWDLRISFGDLGKQCKKRRVQKWLNATIQAVGCDRGVILQYSPCSEFPEAIFRVTVDNDHLRHVAEISDVVFNSKFPTFSLPWRMAAPSKQTDSEASTEHGRLTFAGENSHKKVPVCDDISCGKYSAAMDRLDGLERLILAQSAVFGRLNALSDTDSTSRRVFTELRNGLLRVCQRSMAVGLRRKHMAQEAQDMPRSLQHYFTGVISTSTPCTLLDLESIAHSVRRRVHRAEFDPPFPLTQRPSLDLQCVLISVTSLGEMCSCLSIDSVAVRNGILLKEKKASKRNPTPYLRVVGSLLVDKLPVVESFNSPFVFLPGRGSGEHSSDDIVQALYREKSSFDHRNKEYEHPLVMRELSLQAARALSERTSSNDSLSESEVELYDDVFSLRWKREPALPRIWRVPVSGPADVQGSLQICMPYVIFHGNAVVREFLSALTDDVKCKIVGSLTI